jgi:hypothetical protein
MSTQDPPIPAEKEGEDAKPHAERAIHLVRHSGQPYVYFACTPAMSVYASFAKEQEPEIFDLGDHLYTFDLDKARCPDCIATLVAELRDE